MLKILLDFYLNADYKQNRFSKTLTKKDFEFVLNRKNIIIMFYCSFVLLPVEVNLFPEK